VQQIAIAEATRNLKQVTRGVARHGLVGMGRLLREKMFVLCTGNQSGSFGVTMFCFDVDFALILPLL
jgi:hypothetical protein